MLPGVYEAAQGMHAVMALSAQHLTSLESAEEWQSGRLRRF
jgi:hypothetical protein